MKIIQILFLLSFLFNFSAWAQDLDLSKRDVSLKIINKKTIEVQKSAFEWGVRDANGVILIITK